VEKFLATEMAALNSRIEAGSAAYAPEDHQDYFEAAHLDDYMELSQELPTILRHSILTAANSALEQYLNETCRAHAEVTKTRLDVADLAGTGLRQAQVYLKKVGGMIFPDHDESWVAVQRLRELRNSIVHGDAYVHESNAPLISWLEKCRGVKISASHFVTLEAPFVGEALTWYERFAEVFDEACEPLSLWFSVFPPLPVEDEKSP